MNAERTTDEEMDHILELSSLSRSTSLMLGDAALSSLSTSIISHNDLDLSLFRYHDISPQSCAFLSEELFAIR